MKIHEVVAVVLVCTTGCPGDGGGTGPGTTSVASDGPTEGSPPTTSGSQGEPSSATEPTGTTDATGPDTGTSAGESGGSTGPTVSTGSTGSTDTDTGVVGETETTGSSTAGDTSTAGTTGTTGTTGDTETDGTGTGDTSTDGTGTGDTETDGTATGGSEDPAPGSVDCPALAFDEPIVIDDFSRTGGHMDVPAIAIAWREAMVLARSHRRTDGTPGCEVWWDRRDDAGQELFETVVIPVPATATDATDACEMIGDIVWDPGHQRYIFLHPQQGPAPQARALPLAISPDGELAWTGSGELRAGIFHHGVVSQMRVLGDELYVFGESYPSNDGARPTVHVYSTVDGAWLRTIAPQLYGIREAAIACDEACTQGVFVGSDNTYRMWRIDMVTGALIGPPKDITHLSMFGSPMIDWRPDAIFTTRIPYYSATEQYFETGTLSLETGWDGPDGIWKLPVEPFNGWYEFYEPSWVRTDDGYVVVATRYPWQSALNTGDYRKMRVQVWNLGLDGSVRQAALLPDQRAHTPRVAMKEGRVAITYLHMQEQYDWLDSKRLVFASCPP